MSLNKYNPKNTKYAIFDRVTLIRGGETFVGKLLDKHKSESKNIRYEIRLYGGGKLFIRGGDFCAFTTRHICLLEGDARKELIDDLKREKYKSLTRIEKELKVLDTLVD